MDASGDKRLFAAWLGAHLQQRHMSMNGLSKAMGVRAPTVSRWCNPDDRTMPRWEHINELTRMFGEPPPGSHLPNTPHDAPGMAESGLQALEITSPAADWNGNISEWRVKDATMQVMGYMTGDTVRADARIAPVDGDVVVANVYDTSGQARTVLRVFKEPGYLIPATADASGFEVHEVGKNGAVFGVVYESTRRRQAH